MVEQIAALGSALGALKTISEIAKNVNSIELTQKVIELQTSIIDMQRAMDERERENRQLRDELLEITRSCDIQADLEWQPDGGFWTRKSERTQGLSIPYCPVCWGRDEKLVALTQGAVGYFRCTIHSNGHATQAYHDRHARSAQARTERVSRSYSPFG